MYKSIEKPLAYILYFYSRIKLLKAFSEFKFYSTGLLYCNCKTSFITAT